ncbi:MAG: STAS domain-containing protein [Actinomycetota bacterium]
MSGLEIEVRQEGGATLLALQGELDISSTERVEQELRRVEERSPPTLVIDLRPLRFIDSTGLRLVLGADLRARREGRRLVIVRGPDTVHRVFRIALLDRRLQFVDDPSSVELDGSRD